MTWVIHTDLEQEPEIAEFGDIVPLGFVNSQHPRFANPHQPDEMSLIDELIWEYLGDLEESWA